MACSGCQQQKRQIQGNTFLSPSEKEQTIFQQKIGKCRRCIMASVTGTVLSWVLFIFLLKFACTDCVNPIVLRVLVGIAAVAFTSLAVAHGVAYIKNRNKTAKT